MPSVGSLPRPRTTLLVAVGTLLVVGGACRLLGRDGAADLAWRAATLLALVPLVVISLRSALRGHPGVDVVAVLALAGAAALGENLAGAVIAVMYASGGALEERAGERASRELRALVGRAPSRTLLVVGGTLEETDVAAVRPGDVVAVLPGEVVPVDGLLLAAAVLDESALTGEAAPVERPAGARVGSGVVNAGTALRLRALASAGESTYAGIVRLAQEAQRARAPMVRLADRWALAFVPATLALSGVAWLVSGSAVRALAVLVVATPCPLILAVPVAIMSGISVSARHGAVVKNGGALETLGTVRLLLFDKTGTLTAGEARLADVAVAPGWRSDEALRLGSAVAQASHHVVAAGVASQARSRGIRPPVADDVREEPGSGVYGTVEGRAVALGRLDWVLGRAAPAPWLEAAMRRRDLEGLASVVVAVDGEPVAAILLEERVRPDSARVLRLLRAEGVRRVVMLTGDHEPVARVVGAAAGVDEVLAERTPEGKVLAVAEARRTATTVMVGDGINDAPALAAADAGIAMGARGATASSEAADVVMLADRLDPLVALVRTARRARAIALQSAVAGMLLSVAAMAVAAAGLLAPVAGAVVQEVIDVAVIANALRVLRDPHGPDPAATRRLAAAARTVGAEHARLAGGLDDLRGLADRLDRLPGPQAREQLEGVSRFLLDVVLPHERAEESTLYPAAGALIGGEDPTGAMLRAHVEIERLVRRCVGTVAALPADGPSPSDVTELRRLLYGLHAVLLLHTAQEDDAYLSIAPEAAETPPETAMSSGSPGR